MERSSDERRWALSAVAAVVVAAVLLTGWWLAQPRSETGTGATGSGGSGRGVSGDPGSVDEGADPGREQPAVGREPRLVDGAVRVDSYVARGQRLLLNYTTGVPECYGEVVVGVVREGRRAVTVVLHSVPPAHPAEQCIDLAVTGTLPVDLSAPLGRRRVLDGGFQPAMMVREVAHPHVQLDAGTG